jgi:hypothetical protein
VNVTMRPKARLSALLVGLNGRNVFRVITAFEERRVSTVRADDIASACEALVQELPQVVLMIVSQSTDADDKRFTDVAEAVGAIVFRVDADANDAAFQSVLQDAVDAAVGKKPARETVDITPNPTATVTVPPAPENLDDGWEG